MPILNYTTQIDAAKTVAEITQILAKAGASDVATRYIEGRPVGIMFRTATPFGPRDFVLPVLADKVQMVLHKQKVQPKLQSIEQAERVAWRIVKDWIEAQLAIIQTEMVTLDQVMLPYMKTETGDTVFERYQANQLQLEGSA